MSSVKWCPFCLSLSVLICICYMLHYISGWISRNNYRKCVFSWTVDYMCFLSICLIKQTMVLTMGKILHVFDLNWRHQVRWKMIFFFQITKFIWLSLFRITLWWCHSKWLLRPWDDDVIKWRHFLCDWPFVKESTSHQWISLTKTSDMELWCFLWSASEQMDVISQMPLCSLWRHCNEKPRGISCISISYRRTTTSAEMSYVYFCNFDPWW